MLKLLSVIDVDTKFAVMHTFHIEPFKFNAVSIILDVPCILNTLSQFGRTDIVQAYLPFCDGKACLFG